MRLFIWLVGIVALIVIGTLVLKQRAPVAPLVSQPLSQQQEPTSIQPAAQATAPIPKSATTITTKNGMKIETTKQGTGDAIKVGQTATVQYEGKLEDGTIFDSTARRNNEPFSFTLGSHSVIEGWEEGVLGMKVGETRVLTIPPELAYGPNGYPPVIPQNATLTFTVTLEAIK